MNYRVLHLHKRSDENVKFKGANVKHKSNGKQIKKEENDS
mgnify:FL=1